MGKSSINGPFSMAMLDNHRIIQIMLQVESQRLVLVSLWVFKSLKGQSPVQNHKLIPSSASSHFGWSLGGGVLDLARRGDAESRDEPMLFSGAAWKGLEPFFCLSFLGQRARFFSIFGRKYQAIKQVRWDIIWKLNTNPKVVMFRTQYIDIYI